MPSNRPLPANSDSQADGEPRCQTATGNRGVALITGAAKRIGRAISLELAKHGWTVALHVRSDRHEADDLKAEIEANGGRAIVVQADLAKPSAAKDVLAQCIDADAVPTCLINNASLFQPDEMGNLDVDLWQAHFDVNLRAPVLLAQEIVRQMQHQHPAGTPGNIINIIDQRVWNLKSDFFSYTLTKSALWTATRTMAQALAPHIRVNAIGPGPVLQSIHQTEEDFANENESVLLRRGPSPEEIAHAVSFILSAPTMTGQMIALDGGQHLSG